MLVVAVDTTTRTGSCAVVRGDSVLAVREGDAARPHAERLPAAVVDLLDACGLTLDDVGAYAVAAGPGSFTGLRIGIATVQGLAFANGRPAVGVSALDALAETAREMLLPAPDAVAAWMDAQRGEVFAAVYRFGHPGPAPASVEAVDGPIVAPPEAVLRRWQGLGLTRMWFVGDGALTYRGLLDASGGTMARLIDPVPPLAPAIARLGLRRLAEGGTFLPHAIVPIYVRRPDAELARARREGGE